MPTTKYEGWGATQHIQMGWFNKVQGYQVKFTGPTDKPLMCSAKEIKRDRSPVHITC